MIESYVVQPGDGLFTIAAKLAPGVTVAQRNEFAMAIAVANGGDFSMVLHPGRILWYDTATIPAVIVPEPEPEPDPEPGDRPGPHNTGIAGKGLTVDDLEPWTGGSITTPGTYHRLHFTGTTRIAANDVTFSECMFSGSSTSAYTIRHTGQTGVVFEDCTINGGGEHGVDAPSCLIEPGMPYTVRRCDLSGGVDGLKPQSHPFDSDVLVEDSYIHRSVRYAGTHNDLVHISSRSGRVTIRRCTLDASDTLPDGMISSCFQFGSFQPDHVVGAWLVEDCYLNGGGYAVNASKLSQLSGGYDVTFRRNRFGLRQRFGARSGGGAMTWVDNVWDATGTVEVAGFDVTAGQPV